MSKMIAIWGSPNSGKTTFAVKLAQCIYENYNSTVLVLLCDNVTPALPTLFPNKKYDELYSIGIPLSKTEITQNEVVGSIVTIKGKANFGFLGFCDGENKYTYPDYDEHKAASLLTALKGLADFVIVDCTSVLDTLSSVAIEQADTVIRLVTPDLKSISFFASQLPLYADPKFKNEQHIIGINTTSELYMPIEEAKNHFGDVAFTLPYCRELRKMLDDGDVLKAVADKKYKAKIKAIADKVV